MSNLLAAFRKGQVNILYKDGLSVVAISKALQIPRTTIRNWITSDFQLTRQEDSGRPCKTSLRDKRQSLRLAVSDPTRYRFIPGFKYFKNNSWTDSS